MRNKHGNQVAECTTVLEGRAQAGSRPGGVRVAPETGHRGPWLGRGGSVEDDASEGGNFWERTLPRPRENFRKWQDGIELENLLERRGDDKETRRSEMREEKREDPSRRPYSSSH